MNDERLHILRMVEEGKVSAEEAARLLGALGDAEEAERPVSRRTKKMIRVRVREGDKTKVNVNVPLELARLGLRFVPKKLLEEHDIGSQLDFDELMRLLDEDMDGKIVDIEDEASDTTVEVFIE